MEELANEYFAAVEILTARIKERRERLRRCRRTSPESVRINGELGVLYRERLDAMRIANHLKNYYGRRD